MKIPPAKISIIIGLYLAIATTVFAGANADMQWECHNKWKSICDEDMVATDRGLSAMMALFPPWWLSAFFATGGFHHGFSFDNTPEIKGN